MEFRKQVLLIASAAAAALCLIMSLQSCGHGAAVPAEYTGTYIQNEPADWNLILVNRDNPLPEEHEIELTELSNGRSVDSRIYPYLQAMMDAARDTGLELYVREGYRTHEYQQEVWDDRVGMYMRDGYSRAEAEKLTGETVAVPGTSEHELGLAVDINAYGDTDQWDVYNWLAEHAAEYGFILRYPEGKSDITGIGYEPWHYRYVGREAAEYIMQRGITLEEYLGG